MDGFEANEGVIVMAATNMHESLDPALTRPGRFDRHVAVPLPDVRGRLEILTYYLKVPSFCCRACVSAFVRIGEVQQWNNFSCLKPLGCLANSLYLSHQDKPVAEDVDAASLARRTAGFSGAELANLVNEAALAAGKGGHARIAGAMLDEAQDKILMGSERRRASPSSLARRLHAGLGFCTWAWSEAVLPC